MPILANFVYFDALLVYFYRPGGSYRPGGLTKFTNKRYAPGRQQGPSPFRVLKSILQKKVPICFVNLYKEVFVIDEMK